MTIDREMVTLPRAVVDGLVERIAALEAEVAATSHLAARIAHLERGLAEIARGGGKIAIVRRAAQRTLDTQPHGAARAGDAAGDEGGGE